MLHYTLCMLGFMSVTVHVPHVPCESRYMGIYTVTIHVDVYRAALTRRRTPKHA